MASHHGLMPWWRGVAQVAPAAELPINWHWAHRCDEPFEDPVILDSVPPQLDSWFSQRHRSEEDSDSPEEDAACDDWDVVPGDNMSKDSNTVEDCETSREEAQDTQEQDAGSSALPACDHLAHAASPDEELSGLQRQSSDAAGSRPGSSSSWWHWFSFYFWRPDRR
jgi:hypothetical protein